MSPSVCYHSCKAAYLCLNPRAKLGVFVVLAWDSAMSVEPLEINEFIVRVIPLITVANPNLPDKSKLLEALNALFRKLTFGI